jgi:hypothetical protein
MAKSRKRFQDGHEIMQHYVSGYQIPEGEPKADPALLKDKRKGQAIAQDLLKQLQRMLHKDKPSPKD